MTEVYAEARRRLLRWLPDAALREAATEQPPELQRDIEATLTRSVELSSPEVFALAVESTASNTRSLQGYREALIASPELAAQLLPTMIDVLGTILEAPSVEESIEGTLNNANADEQTIEIERAGETVTIYDVDGRLLEGILTPGETYTFDVYHDYEDDPILLSVAGADGDVLLDRPDGFVTFPLEAKRDVWEAMSVAARWSAPVNADWTRLLALRPLPEELAHSVLTRIEACITAGPADRTVPARRIAGARGFDRYVPLRSRLLFLLFTPRRVSFTGSTRVLGSTAAGWAAHLDLAAAPLLAKSVETYRDRLKPTGFIAGVTAAVEKASPSVRAGAYVALIAPLDPVRAVQTLAPQARSELTELLEADEARIPEIERRVLPILSGLRYIAQRRPTTVRARLGRLPLVTNSAQAASQEFLLHLDSGLPLGRMTESRLFMEAASSGTEEAAIAALKYASSRPNGPLEPVLRGTSALARRSGSDELMSEIARAVSDVGGRKRGRAPKREVVRRLAWIARAGDTSIAENVGQRLRTALNAHDAIVEQVNSVFLSDPGLSEELSLAASIWPRSRERKRIRARATLAVFKKSRDERHVRSALASASAFFPTASEISSIETFRDQGLAMLERSMKRISSPETVIMIEDGITRFRWDVLRTRARVRRIREHLRSVS